MRSEIEDHLRAIIIYLMHIICMYTFLYGVNVIP